MDHSWWDTGHMGSATAALSSRKGFATESSMSMLRFAQTLSSMVLWQEAE